MTTTADPAVKTATDRYTIISADTHAGGSHEEYREYLDPKYVADFDAWRGQYKNPWKDLRDTDLRVRNWDDDRRDRDQLADGVVAEVIYPNTIPPFFESGSLVAAVPSPEDYELRIAGLRLQARALGIARLTAGSGGGSVEFAQATQVDPAVLVRLIGADPRQFRLDPRQRLVFRAQMNEPEERLAYAGHLLAQLAATPAGGGAAAARRADMAS